MALSPSALADDVRPVQLQIQEQEPGTFLLRWQVPRVLPPRAMPTPILPQGCVPEGERTVREQPGAWFNRLTVRCSAGISDRSIGIHYPIGNPSLSTVIRVELLSGERYATLLSPTDSSWTIPAAPAIDAGLRAAQSALLAGVAHTLELGVHLAFLGAVVLLGYPRLLAHFGAGQLLAALAAMLGLHVGASLGEVGLALGAVLLANQALLPVQRRRQLGGLALASGLVHGLGWSSSWDGSASFLLGLLGMDVALLLMGAPLGWMLARAPGLRRAAIYATGVGAVAFGLQAWSSHAAVGVGPAADAARLPELQSASDGGAQGSQRVSPRAPDAALQSFLAIEAFEVRHEVLVRLRDVAGSVGLGATGEIEVEQQAVIKAAVGDLVASTHTLEIDGRPDASAIERVDFMAVDEKGALPRQLPVTELIEQAFVGVTFVELTPATARDVRLTWTWFDLLDAVPATITDPETSRTAALTRDSPEVHWQYALAQDPVPDVDTVRVEPARVPLPLLSLPLGLLAAAIVGAGLRGRRPRHAPEWLRVVIAAAILLGPIADVAVPLPFSSAPDQTRTRRVLAALLPNVYRALEFRDESAAYDRLSLLIAGDTLTDIYLEHRRALEMEERGGARARVEAVEVTEVFDVVAAAGGGFETEASWSVSGTVTHFGHRHFRQNRYRALVAVVPDRGAWKIRSIDVRNEERVQ